MKKTGKTAGIVATVVITALVILYFLVVGFAAPFALIIFLPLVAALAYNAVSRIREIKKEDTDDYRKY